MYLYVHTQILYTLYIYIHAYIHILPICIYTYRVVLLSAVFFSSSSIYLLIHWFLCIYVFICSLIHWLIDLLIYLLSKVYFLIYWFIYICVYLSKCLFPFSFIHLFMLFILSTILLIHRIIHVYMHPFIGIGPCMTWVSPISVLEFLGFWIPFEYCIEKKQIKKRCRNMPKNGLPLT